VTNSLIALTLRNSPLEQDPNKSITNPHALQLKETPQKEKSSIEVFRISGIDWYFPPLEIFSMFSI